MRSLADHLRSVDPPHVELLVLRAGSDPLAALPALPGFAVRRVDGRRCRTKAALLDEFARALDFPAHFGRNWDAFEDCLNDLSWLEAEGYASVVTDAQAVLARHDADYATFVAVLEAAGREWATPRTLGVPRPAAPFHVELTATPRHVAPRRNWRVPVRDLRA
jgi:RNAse (barnase) inhibitor barstar